MPAPPFGLRVQDTLGQAAASLRLHPLRSVLGGLAIATAVGTMVVVMTALDGVAAYARRNAERAFGSETFVIARIASPGQISRRELEQKLRRNPPVDRRDLRALERLAGGRTLYAPSAQRNGEVTAGSRTYDYAAITGTGAALADIRDLGIGRGRFLAPQEEAAGAQVAVLGADPAATLFPATDPIGRTVRIAGRGFTVIGVQETLGTSGGASLDRYVWVPYRAFERMFGEPATIQVFAARGEATDTQGAQDHARISLRAHRQLGPAVEDNFDILTPDAARSFVLRLSQRIGVAAFPISLMALLAAIVVITNTTLVSVTERTREIGVRRAIGASAREITREVLAEAALVAVVGGAVGVLAAAALVTLGARLSDVPLAVDLETVVWSLLAAAGSGLAAGWYPARRATAVDVVTALRQE